MPSPKNYENKNDFVNACVSIKVKEGMDQDQAVAACLNIWKNRNKSKDEVEKDRFSIFSEDRRDIINKKG